MNHRYYKYFLMPFLAFLFVACKQSKYVPEGYYLLNENNTKYYVESTDEWDKEHELIDEGELEDLIKPRRNKKFLGIKFKLGIYNSIDTTRYNKQVVRKRKKFNKKAKKRKAKEDKINARRIRKAKKKGKDYYKKKTKGEKTERLGWRNWVITHWGEPPVIMDTAKISKSKQQMEVFLSQRGFKYAEITDSIVYNEKKRKTEVTYYVNPGRPYVINSITFDQQPRNSQLIKQYDRMVRKEGTDIHVGDQLDEDKFDDERDHYTKFLKDNAYFGFTKSYINFVVDTTVGDYKADVTIYILPKEVQDPANPDTTTTINHFTYLVDDVTYKLHNIDSASFKDWERYKKRCEMLGFQYPYKDENGNYHLLDTMFVLDTVISKYFINFDPHRRKRHNVGLFGKCIDTNIYYKGYFIYNEIPFIKPVLLDKQNFLEHTEMERNELKYAKDYYIDRTFKSFLRLDVFAKINPKLEIDPANPLGRFVDVTYDLTPMPKQIFIIEPRATNTSSILGISGRISYTNKNLFRAGNQLTISVEGGMQSQPLVQSDDDDTSRIDLQGLNTFEIGPEITYKIPRFFPMGKKMQENVSKRAFPSTQITSLYNYQDRREFNRHIAELNYKWKFSIPPDEIQRVTVTPLILNYVFLEKTDSFELLLQETNDPFLINSYENFFSLGFMNFRHEFTNAALPKHKRNQKFLENSFSNTFDIDASGLILNTIFSLADKSQSFGASFNDTGKVLFKVPFAQYGKITNTLIYNFYINKKNRIATRLITGVGLAYGNGFSLPYTQSFVAGGSNDIRAFPARTMAPGGTQVWRDSLAPDTQIGDMKLEANLEWRFNMGGNWNGALFLDIGNIWKVKADSAADPGLFTFSNFWRQAAIGTGFGIRYDLSFLIVRVDLAWPLYNPYLPAGHRWWLRSADENDEYVTEVKSQKAKYRIRDWPFSPRINFGIGYPF